MPTPWTAAASTSPRVLIGDEGSQARSNYTEQIMAPSHSVSQPVFPAARADRELSSMNRNLAGGQGHPPSQ